MLESDFDLRKQALPAGKSISNESRKIFSRSRPRFLLFSVIGGKTEDK